MTKSFRALRTKEIVRSFRSFPSPRVRCHKSLRSSSCSFFEPIANGSYTGDATATSTFAVPSKEAPVVESHNEFFSLLSRLPVRNRPFIRCQNSLHDPHVQVHVKVSLELGPLMHCLSLDSSSKYVYFDKALPLILLHCLTLHTAYLLISLLIR